MTTSERLAMINAKRNSINNAETAKKNAEDELRSQLISQILDMGERIENVIAIGNALKDNGFLFVNISRNDERLKPYGYGNSVVAEGIYHHVGLMARHLKRSTNSVEYIGIIMGGACGEYDFVTDGTTVKSVHEQTKMTKPVPISHLKQFLAEFPVYEKALYAWVDATMA